MNNINQTKSPNQKTYKFTPTMSSLFFIPPVQHHIFTTSLKTKQGLEIGVKCPEKQTYIPIICVWQLRNIGVLEQSQADIKLY